FAIEAWRLADPNLISSLKERAQHILLCDYTVRLTDSRKDENKWNTQFVFYE
ncbi:unnamed protein product, partial [Rotaria sp. Silwood2]